MKNWELFQNPPGKTKLKNDGVAQVSEDRSTFELERLRFELENFVCEGEYRRGLENILSSYVNNLGQATQRAAWVSGFYGSGKSHLVKMLRYLWTDYTFPDGATARGIVNLPVGIADLLKELDVAGKRNGGLWAGSGKMGTQQANDVNLEILSIVFQATGLPKKYPQARFVLWLRKRGYYDGVKQFLEDKGEDLYSELDDLYVSPLLRKALMSVAPDFAESDAEARSIIIEQFPYVTSVSVDDLTKGIKAAVAQGKDLPCSLIVLDEIQEYIHEDSERVLSLQLAVEACCNELGSRLMFVGTGQSALSDLPLLQKLQDRFRIKVALSDTDVEAVTRRVILLKRPDKKPELEAVLEQCSGEISRHLNGSKIEPMGEDQDVITQDYPLLPVRRRFWERALRSVDEEGTYAQLRSQLRIIDEATKATADKPVGTVIPTDFLYEEKARDMIETGALLREIHELIIEQKEEGTPEGKLRSRICALAFLISKLPHEGGADLGVRATEDTLADLLVEDLREGSTELRKEIPKRLKELLGKGLLMQVNNEYHIQTRESRVWTHEYEQLKNNVLKGVNRIEGVRTELLREAVEDEMKHVKLVHGKSNLPRKIRISFGDQQPAFKGGEVPVWVRDEWTYSLKSFLNDAREAGPNDPTIYVFLPKKAANELKQAIASREAARATISSRGVPSTEEGKEARNAVETYQKEADQKCIQIINEVLENAQVFLAGGSEVTEGMMLHNMVMKAAESALKRLYPYFDTADDKRWHRVMERARGGSPNALEVLGYNGNVDSHPVCSEILKELGNWKKGGDMRKKFESPPYGWPRDAVNASVAILVLTGYLQSRFQGKELGATDLDRSSIGTAEFRLESVRINPKQKVAVRILFKSADITCKTGAETEYARVFLEKMRELAEESGGNPPWPQQPSTNHLDELESLSGSEQLHALYDRREQLETKAKKWKQTAEEIKKRKPRWEALQKLLKHASPLPVAHEINMQVKAVTDNRSALGEPNPLTNLCERLTKELRKAIKEYHDSYCEEYERLMSELDADESWCSLSSQKQEELKKKADLPDKPQLSVGTEEEVQNSLENRSLSDWETHINALPSYFQTLKREAAKELEPKAVSFTLPRMTLKTPDDVEKWVKQTRKLLLEKLKDENTGAVILE